LPHPERLSLTRVDPRTLKPFGPKVRVGYLGSMVLSADGSTLAAVGSLSLSSGWVELIDLAKMRVRSKVAVPGSEVVSWLSPTRLLLLGNDPGGVHVRVFDTRTRRIVRDTRLSGDVPLDFRGQGDRVVITGLGAVFLLEGLGERPAPVRLVLVTPSGATRVVTLARIAGGSFALPKTQFGHFWQPALAADRQSARAFVVGAAGQPIADIDLSTLATTYRPGVPAPKPASSLSESVRVADIIGDGRLAISGYDEIFSPRPASRSVGLKIVDFATGTTLAPFPQGTTFWRANGLLIATATDAFGSWVMSFTGDYVFSAPAKWNRQLFWNDRYLYIPPSAQDSFVGPWDVVDTTTRTTTTQTDTNDLVSLISLPMDNFYAGA
jgi:hypothetical protein